jgi:sialidase-1
MASLLNHSSGVLLFSNPRTVGRDASGKELPDSRGKRENLTIQLSRDDGSTWPVRKTLEAGPSAYSDMAELSDGSLLCLYERNDSIDCARFTLEWIQTP